MHRIDLQTIKTGRSTEQTYSIVQGTAADLPALLDDANIPELNRAYTAEQRIEAKLADPYSGISFGGLRSSAEAAAIFTTDGWQDGEQRARREVATMNLGTLVPEATSVRRRRVIGDAGDDVRVEAALAGNWDRAFESRARRATRQPVALSIGCAFGAGAAVSHEQLFWSGVQMAALCDLLEDAGYRIELRALKANRWPSAIHLQDWTVKHADQPLRWDTTLALFGHAGVYRTFGWAANGCSRVKIPHGAGEVLQREEFTTHLNRAAAAGLIAPLSLIVPAAYSRGDALGNLRTALVAVREGRAAA